MTALSYEEVLSGNGGEYNTFPLSSSQERLWFLHQLAPTDPAYHMCGAFRFLGPLDLDRLADVVCTVCRRHEALRTVFRELDERPVQVVLPDPVTRLVVRSIADDDLSAGVRAEGRRPFDLKVAPARFTCLRIGAEDHALVVAIHHLVCDGLSVAILIREFSALYGGTTLDPLPIQFADFALWERAQIAEGAFQADLAWWRESLAGMPMSLGLQPPVQGAHTFAIPSSIVGSIQNLAASLETTPFVVVLAAFAGALGEHLGRTELIVGTPVAGRPSIETEGVVGLFVNTIPIPIRLSPRSSLRDAARALRGTVTHALTHAGVPFDRIVDAVAAPRSSAEAPLVQALIAWRPGAELTEFVIPGAVTVELAVDLEAPKFDVSLEVAPARDAWAARLEFAKLQPNTAANLARRLVDILASDPDRLFAIESVAGVDLGVAPEPVLAEPDVVDATERIVAHVWREILGTAPGRNDNFFASGGHSLLGARILTRIRARTGVDLPLRTLFEAPTIAALADRVRSSGRTTVELIPKAPPGPIVPSSGQQALWLLHRFDPTSVAYNISGILRIEGSIDAKALSAALRTVVARQPGLRTTIHLIDGAPVQVVSEEAKLDLEVCALGDCSSEALDAALRSAADRLAAFPFDFAHDLLLRATWIDGGRAGSGLVLGTTHAAFDGSHAVFFSELERAYAAEQGLTLNRPAPSISYSDYAAWQRARLPEVIRAHLPYWTRQLSSDPGPLELPTDRPRPPVRSGRGAVRTFAIDVTLANRVRTFARTNSASVHMVLFAAWTVLLHRFSGQERFMVGSPVEVRPADAEDVVGCFVNPVVLAVDLSGRPAFGEIVAKMRTLVLDAHAHAECPFHVLVETLGRPRDLSRNPLFDGMFVFADLPIPPRLGTTTTRFLEWNPSVARFDILWALHDVANGGFGGSVEYATDLFDSSTVDRMIESFTVLLSAALDAPATGVDALSLLRRPERHKILVEWNRTRRDIPGELTLHRRFERAADRSPAAPAVLAQQTVLTYAELDARANRWAHLLIGCGIGVGDRVAFWADRCGESIEVLLGILKAGAAYVPMAASWPAARVAWVAQELGLPAIVTQARFASMLDGIDLPTLRHRVVIDDAGTERQIGSLPSTRPLPAAGPDDVAYVIFTSGSTGTPKGVVVRHRRVVNLIDWVNRTFSINAGDRLLFVTSYCFDLSVYDVFGILDAGGSIRVAEADDIADPGRLWSLLRSDGITFWDSAPAMLGQLVPFLTAQPPDPNSPLRLVFLSGDWIPLALPDQIRRVFPSAEVIGLGGATEAVIWSNFHRIGDVAPHWRSIPYGRPIQNAAYYVLDGRLEPCPVGVVGDLFIGGEVLADGYTDPVLTAERFVPDPHADRPGAPMYRTGDRARFWADGTIEFVGRLDQQIKVRGYRIERGEIEAVLGEHPAVATCVVLPRPDGSGDRRLIAWYVPQDGVGVTSTELRMHVAAKVPDYMVPSVFVAVDAIPTTENGKLDARRLPDPEGARPVLDAAFVAPRDDLERIVADTWRSVLGVDQVGAQDNFFDLGGHSSAMVRAQAALEEKLGRLVPIVELYRHGSVEDLARYLADGNVAPVGVDRKLRDQRLLAQRNRDQRNRLLRR